MHMKLRPVARVHTAAMLWSSPLKSAYRQRSHVRFLALSLAGLTGICLSVSARAMPPAPPPATPLSLAELTALALRNNPDTTIAWSAVVQSEAAERVARAGWWPTLTASYRSEEHTSELQSLMRISYAVFCLQKKKHQKDT